MSRGLATGIRRAVGPILFLGCALLLTVILERSFVIQSDEGYTLNAAWQLWNGLRMYDDFRLFVGPGSGYAIFAVWKLIGGPSYLGARLLAVGFSFSSTVALYLLLRRSGIRGLNLALTIVAWLLQSSLYVPLNHNSFSSYAALWFLLPFSRLAREPGADPGASRPIFDAVLAGVAAGVVFVFLPSKGALLAASAAAFLFAIGFARRTYRSGSTLLGAFAATIAPLFLRWGPPTLIRQWLLIPVTGHYLSHTGATGSFVVAVVVLLGGMAVIAIRLGDRTLKALAAIQAALFASMSHNMELAHFAINAFPILIFVSLVIHRRFGESPLGQRFPAVLALGTVTASLVGWSAFTSAGADFLSTSTLYVDVLGHRPKAFTSPRIAAARAIYAGPFLPGLYYLLGKRNPFFVSETVVCEEACQRRLVAQLSAVQPELAFLDYGMVRHLSYDENAPVDTFLRQHYLLCPSHGGIVVRAIAPEWCP